MSDHARIAVSSLAERRSLRAEVADALRAAVIAGQMRPGLTASAEEHHELLDALLARDSTAAEAVMARHIGHIRGIWAAPPAPPAPSQ